MQPNPILVENLCGNTIDSFHRGAAAVIDDKARVLASWGNINLPVFTHSSLKYLQAISFIETGAAEAFKLDDKEIALACSSNTGESEHVNIMNSWLNKLDLTENSLLCGMSRPKHDPTFQKLIQDDHSLSPIFNPCCGQHLSFLSTCLHQGMDIENYIDLNHPIQIHIRKIVEELLQVEGNTMPHAFEKCGIPVFAYPLKNIALGMTRLSPRSIGLSKTRKNAIDRIREAIIKYPFYVAGSNQFDTALIEVTKGRAIIKAGSGGVYTACLPEKGLGFGVKIDDGNLKAAEVAIGTLLSHYEVFNLKNIARLSVFLEPTIRNTSNIDLGRYRSHPGWLTLKC